MIDGSILLWLIISFLALYFRDYIGLEIFLVNLEDDITNTII